MCCDPLRKKVTGCWTMEALVCNEGRITFLGIMESKLGRVEGVRLLEETDNRQYYFYKNLELYEEAYVSVV
jgi:hypothetical protein